MKESNENPGIDKPKSNQVELIKQKAINNLKLLNGLKTPKYGEVISQMYVNFNLEESCLDDNDLTENNITLLSNIYNKINGITNSRDRKKKNNKGNKDGMGLLLSLDIKEPLILYHPYSLTNNKMDTSNSYFECFLYSIHICINEDLINLGFIFPINIGEIFKIKLISRKTREISYAEIKKEKKLLITNEKMENIVSYHYYICNQLNALKRI